MKLLRDMFLAGVCFACAAFGFSTFLPYAPFATAAPSDLSNEDARTAGVALLARSARLEAMLAARFEASAPAERRLLEDCDDGRLDDFTLLDAALIAGGMHGVEERQQAAAALRNCLPPGASLPAAPRLRARVLLEALHEYVLAGGYQIDCRGVPDSLRDGRFNCITATVLYDALCLEHELPSQLMAAPGHVYCRVIDGDKAFDVETTCREWLASENPPRQLPDVRQPGAIRKIGSLHLLAKLYYNQGIDLLRDSRYTDAVSCFALAVRMDPHDQQAQENLLAAINNWALSLGDSARYAEAAGLLQEGLQAVPAYEPFRENDLYIHQQWIVALCGQDRYAEALRLAETGWQRRPEAPLFDLGRLAVYRRWALQLFEQQQEQAAWEKLDEMQQRFDDRPEAAQAALGVALQYARQLADEGRRDEALAALQRAVEWGAESPEIEQCRQDLTQRQP